MIPEYVDSILQNNREIQVLAGFIYLDAKMGEVIKLDIVSI